MISENPIIHAKSIMKILSSGESGFRQPGISEPLIRLIRLIYLINMISNQSNQTNQTNHSSDSLP